MSGKTAGQLAYETMHASLEQRDQGGGHIPWLELDESMRGDFGALKREDMEAAAAAAAVETEQLRLVREDRDQLRKQVLDLAADLEDEAASLSATGVTRGNRLRHETAAKLRHAAGPPS